MTDILTKRYHRLKWLRRAARLTSLLSIAGLLMFAIGEGFDTGRLAPAEWAGFLFFPVGLIAGLIIGWKSELAGGLIALISLLGFYLIYGLLLSGSLPSGPAFLVFALPAFLFLAAGCYGRFGIKNPAERMTAGHRG